MTVLMIRSKDKIFSSTKDSREKLFAREWRLCCTKYCASNFSSSSLRDKCTPGAFRGEAKNHCVHVVI